MSEKKLIWLAGMFEGEGTTGLFKQKRKNGKWRLQTYFLICNNDPIIIDKIKEIASEIGINMTIYQRHENPQKDWNLNYQILTKRMSHTYRVLKAIYPYLIGQKKYIAKLTIEFLESRELGKTRKKYSSKEFNLYKECKKYNQRGRKRKYLKSSETIRQALKSDDIVRTSTKVGDWIE
jgi:signal recognition particle subunit SEC65